MISAEPAGDIGAGVLPITICRVGVGGDGTDPQRGDAKSVKVSIVQGLLNACEVSTVVIGLRQDGRVVHRTVVAAVATALVPAAAAAEAVPGSGL